MVRTIEFNKTMSVVIIISYDKRVHGWIWNIKHPNLPNGASYPYHWATPQDAWNNAIARYTKLEAY